MFYSFYKTFSFYWALEIHFCDLLLFTKQQFIPTYFLNFIKEIFKVVLYLAIKVNAFSISSNDSLLFSVKTGELCLIYLEYMSPKPGLYFLNIFFVFFSHLNQMFIYEFRTYILRFHVIFYLLTPQFMSFF